MIGVAFVVALAGAYLLGLLVGLGRAHGDGQDRKFAFRRGRFVNRVSGEEIPLDEPVIIFRGRDRHALPVLRYYRRLVEDDHHKAVVTERIFDFSSFAARSVLKEPGITHDYQLDDRFPGARVRWGDKDLDPSLAGPLRELQLGKHMEVPPEPGPLIMDGKVYPRPQSPLVKP